MSNGCKQPARELAGATLFAVNITSSVFGLPAGNTDFAGLAARAFARKRAGYLD